MAQPSYLSDEGALTDGEAWVAVTSTVLTVDGTPTITWNSGATATTDWSQYMDLVIIGYGRATASDTNALVRMRFNNDTASVYDWQEIRGSGSVVAPAFIAARNYVECAYWMADSASANVFGGAAVHLYDINSGKWKTGQSLSAGDRNGSGYVNQYGFVFKRQDPITRIDIWNHHGGNWKAGTRFDLFGVLPRMVS